MEDTFKASNIQAISISLEAGGKTRLFIMLSQDGTVNRMGSGQFDEDDLDLYLGTSNEKLFEELLARVPPQLLERSVTMEDPDALGLPCELTISIVSANESVTTIYRYGSRSIGPPDALAHFIRVARDITEQWFQKQQQA